MRTLVIDIGTSGLRSGIVNDDASISHLHHVPCPPTSPAGGLVEFDPVAMWTAVQDVVAASLAGGPVDSIGITTQRASTVAWRASTGRPLGPGLGWQDLRTVGECIMAKIEHGLGLAPNQTATKAAWLLRNYIADESERADDDLRIGTVDSWITWCLTDGAHHVTDHTNAAVTGLTEPSGLSWNPTVFEALGLHLHHMPRIVESAGYIGDATAVPGSPPIMALIGDQQSSLVGQGCVEPGRAKITFGTGGMLDLFVGDDAPRSARRDEAGTFPIVAFSRGGRVHYGTEAVMLSAGTNIEWLVEDMGLLSDAAQSHEVASACADSGGVVFVPALLGLGTPWWDYGARGTLLGVTRGTDRAHIVRAVLEGVAHRGADLIEAAERDAGIGVTDVGIDGGMSRNPTFVQALADAAGRPIRVSPVSEATTLGAGFLAGCETGQWSHPAAAAALLQGGVTVHPLGEPTVSRQQWAEAVSRARSWIPDLSALDF